MNPFFEYRPACRFLWSFPLVWALVLGSPIAAEQVEATLLTTAAQVRGLTVERARQAVPVHLRGVYIGEADPEGIAFVIQDETEGIYVQGPADQVAGLVRGDLIELDGVTDPGGFAPYVVAHALHKVGQGKMPAPFKVTLDELNSGQMDAKWVEISGVVRSFEPKAPTDAAPPPPGTRYASPVNEVVGENNQNAKLKLAAGGARVTVGVNGNFNPEDYLDAEIRLQGLCFNLHNRNRQFVRPYVQVPRGAEIVVVRSSPSKPFSGEPRPVANLLRFDQLTGTLGHRVHVRGVVVHHRLGATLWVRDRDHSLRVETTQKEALQPGDVVDVLGFPARSDYSAVLEDAVFKKRAAQVEPTPHVLEDVSSALRNDADLVRLDAVLTEVRRFPDSVALTLDWHRTLIRAQMYLSENEVAPAEWLAGSRVRVSGVCSVKTDEAIPLGGLWEPRSFQLLLRSSADLAVLQSPPWWNAERVVWILAGFLALSVAAVAAVMFASKRRLNEQEHRRAMAETEFAAILNERNRVAREIHDTLSQNLGAISVQLELTRAHAAQMSEPALNHLGAAHKLARMALADARDSIWNMRSQVLEKSDLSEALQGILERMTEGTGIEPRMRTEGTQRRLPPVVENNLLRIGQEGITNATKHARPTHIDLELIFDGRSISLVVEDDGVGFSPEAQPREDRRSFGLVGIRERAELLGGKFEIKSAPGKGTRVTVVVSV